MERPLGRLFEMTLRVRQPLIRLGPLVAVGGGMLAGGVYWDEATLLRLILLWLLADPLLGYLHHQGATAGPWYALFRARFQPQASLLPDLPYALPDSLSHRANRWLGGFRLWWQEAYAPHYGGALASFAATAALMLIVSVVVGSSIALFTAGLVGLIIIAGGVSSAAGDDARRTLLEFAFPWLMSGVAFAVFNPLWLLVLLLSSIIYYAGLRLVRGEGPYRAIFVFAQVALALLLAGVRQPLAAGAVGVLCVLQWLFWRLPQATSAPLAVFGRVQPFTVVGILIAALGIAPVVR